MFNALVDVVSDSSTWAYAVLFLVAAFDAVVPVVPSETAVITAGVVAAAGELRLSLVIGLAAAGAMAGDNAAYLLGRRFAGPLTRRLGTHPPLEARIAWTSRQLDERGGELIAVARFVPGGRTAVTLSAGMLRFPWRRFVLLDAAAALGWALYASSLGFFGGETFERSPWQGLLVALGIAFSLTAAVECVRWYRRHGE